VSIVLFDRLGYAAGLCRGDGLGLGRDDCGRDGFRCSDPGFLSCKILYMSYAISVGFQSTGYAQRDFDRFWLLYDLIGEYCSVETIDTIFSPHFDHRMVISSLFSDPMFT
jgi:hypothetical protein